MSLVFPFCLFFFLPFLIGVVRIDFQVSRKWFPDRVRKRGGKCEGRSAREGQEGGGGKRRSERYELHTYYCIRDEFLIAFFLLSSLLPSLFFSFVAFYYRRQS